MAACGRAKLKPSTTWAPTRFPALPTPRMPASLPADRTRFPIAITQRTLFTPIFHLRAPIAVSAHPMFVGHTNRRWTTLHEEWTWIQSSFVSRICSTRATDLSPANRWSQSEFPTALERRLPRSVGKAEKNSKANLPARWFAARASPSQSKVPRHRAPPRRACDWIRMAPRFCWQVAQRSAKARKPL